MRVAWSQRSVVFSIDATSYTAVVLIVVQFVRIHRVEVVHGPCATPIREPQPLVTDPVPPVDEVSLRAALEAALARLIADTNLPAEAVLAQAEAELNALLLGKDLRDPGAAQLARVIRDVVAEARRQLHDQDHFTC